MLKLTAAGRYASRKKPHAYRRSGPSTYRLDGAIGSPKQSSLTRFAALDTHNIGALGRDELNKFALLTGFQGDGEDLFEEITLLLNKWGSSTAQSHSRAISLRNFARIVSRTGVLPLSKAELRRTIRFDKAPEVQGPLAQSGQGMWRSIKHMKIFTAATQWKQGICWHRSAPPWLLDPTLCNDPCCPLKTHPELFRRF